jgi:hypothetical protein
MYIGIDGGVGGAMCAYNNETNELVLTPMPVISVPKIKKGFKKEYNIPAIIDWLKQFDNIKMAVLEKSQAFPGQGVVSQFTIGKNFGIMSGILAALKIPHQLVAPRSWQNVMFEGVSHGKGQSKQASILVALRLFPDKNQQFIATERGSKIDDGLTDSTLMAVYASKIS